MRPQWGRGVATSARVDRVSPRVVWCTAGHTMHRIVDPCTSAAHHVPPKSSYARDRVSRFTRDACWLCGEWKPVSRSRCAWCCMSGCSQARVCMPPLDLQFKFSWSAPRSGPIGDNVVLRTSFDNWDATPMTVQKNGAWEVDRMVRSRPHTRAAVEACAV